MSRRSNSSSSLRLLSKADSRFAIASDTPVSLAAVSFRPCQQYLFLPALFLFASKLSYWKQRRFLPATPDFTFDLVFSVNA